MSNATVTAEPIAGVCFMVDGSENFKHIKPDRFIDGNWCFDIAKVKRELKINYIEIVYVPDTEYILICDEEALLVNEPTQNFLATILAGFPIYGNVLYCHTSAVN